MNKDLIIAKQRELIEVKNKIIDEIIVYAKPYCADELNYFQSIVNSIKAELAELEKEPTAKEEEITNKKILKWMENEDSCQWHGSPSYAWVCAFYKALKDGKIK